MNKYAGADWVKRAKKLDAMSTLGERAADLLGDVFCGIYHIAGSPSFDKIDWTDPNFIQATIYGPISSFDDNILTRLIVLAHDRLLRVEIIGAAPRYLRIGISLRYERDHETYWKRMPHLEDHIETIRKHFGSVPEESFSLEKVNA